MLQQAQTMKLAKRDDGWWIEGAAPYFIDDTGPFTDYGPYETKADASDGLRGLRRFEEIVRGECPEPAAAALPPLGGCAGAVDQSVGQVVTSLPAA